MAKADPQSARERLRRELVDWEGGEPIEEHTIRRHAAMLALEAAAEIADDEGKLWPNGVASVVAKRIRAFAEEIRNG